MKLARLALILLALAAVSVACRSVGDEGDATPIATPPRNEAPFTPTLVATPTRRPDSLVSSTPSRSPAPPAASPTPFVPPPNADIVPAPIDRLEVVVRESFPPQYALQVTAGLASGCVRPATHEVTRQGATITVRVLNAVTRNVVCTLIYGSYELNLNLGSDFQPGRTYTVNVNDKTLSFTAR